MNNNMAIDLFSLYRHVLHAQNLYKITRLKTSQCVFTSLGGLFSLQIRDFSIERSC